MVTAMDMGMAMGTDMVMAQRQLLEKAPSFLPSSQVSQMEPKLQSKPAALGFPTDGVAGNSHSLKSQGQ